MSKEDALVLHTQGVSSDTDWAVIAREMDACADCSNISKPAWHLVMSFKHGEQVTNEQFVTCSMALMRELGADPDKTQFVLVRHNDTHHAHAHILINRVQLVGSVISDQHDFRRSHAAMRVVEQVTGLTAYEKPAEQSNKGRMAELRQAIDKAMVSSHDFASFKKTLEAQSIKVLSNEQSTGRIAGLSFVAAGHTYKGSSLGKAYSLTGLQKRGLGIQGSQHQKVTPAPSAGISQQARMPVGQSMTHREDPDKNKREMDKWLAQRAAESRKHDQSNDLEGQTEQELE